MTAYCALIAAAGIGSRMGSAIPKQHLMLRGRSVIEWSLAALDGVQEVNDIVVVADPLDEYWQALQSRVQTEATLHTVAGASTRAGSVASGLRWIKERFGSDIWVLVHDAARPLVRVDDIERLIQSVEVESAIGGLLGVPAVDTLKQVGTGNQVGKTIDRELVWMAMTPQMFQAGPLLDAIDAAMLDKLPLTDESSAMELANFQPLMVECHRDNIKITHPQDIALSEHLMDTASKKTKSTIPVSHVDETPS